MIAKMNGKTGTSKQIIGSITKNRAEQAFIMPNIIKTGRIIIVDKNVK